MSEGRRISAFRGFLDKTNEGKSTLNEIDLNLFDLAVTTAVDEELEIIPNDSKVVENPPKSTAQVAEGRWAEISPAIRAGEQISVDSTLNQSEKFNKEEQTPNQQNLDDEKAHGENRSNNDGWTQYIDDESGLPYWYNEETGEAKWGEVDKTATQAPIEIQGVWEKYYDDQGNPFYYNTVTGVSDWEIPADAILSTGIVDDNNDFVTKRASSIKSIRSARSFGLSRIGSSKFASFSEKVVMIDNSAKYERGVSAKSLKSIKSAASFKVTQMPSVADTLKPKVPLKNASKNGFQILREGASILREQRDSNGVLWTEYQAVNDGPVFYATEDPQSGQWGKPEVFDLLESPRNNKLRGKVLRLFLLH